MSKLAAIFVMLSALWLPTNAFAQATEPRPGCAVDTTIAACVTSASVVLDENYDVGDDPIYVNVSVSVRVLNTTDYPIGIAIRQGSWAFTPQNASVLTDESAEISGIEDCYDPNRCTFTTVAPGRTALIQLAYGSRFAAAGLPLMQIARNGSFSASLYINERGDTRLISLPLEGFAFGNGLMRAR